MSKKDQRDKKWVTPKDGHVSVIYVHGMGSQRRFEETSRIIDSLDKIAGQNRGEVFKGMSKIKPKLLETDEPGELQTYIRTRYQDEGSEDETVKNGFEVRFFEHYWADIMAKPAPPWAVMWWILLQVLRPLKIAKTCWRDRSRLKRAALMSLSERPRKWKAFAEERDFFKVLRLYGSFNDINEHKNGTTGTFDEFLVFIAKKNSSSSETTKRLQRLAKAWRKFYNNQERRTFFLLLSILLSLALAFGAIVYIAYGLLRVLQNYFKGLPIDVSGVEVFGVSLSDPTPASVAGAVSAILVGFVLAKFLSGYMGDVQVWATYDETDENNTKRKDVLERGMKLIRNVVNDPKCKRVVIVSHSLGTSVALDTVVYSGTRNKAFNQDDPMTGEVDLSKVSHFITLASPVDKINYFFESQTSKFRRYLRVTEELRGDIASPPFTQNAQRPYAHWVNFWDEADIISGPLQSPVSHKTDRLKVDNVHVKTLHFPGPGTAHSAYFNDQSVMQSIFDMIYLKGFTYPDAPFKLDENGNKNGLDYEARNIGPGAGHGWAKYYHVLAIALPWIGALWAICSVLPKDSNDLTVMIEIYAKFSFFVIAGLLLMSYLLSLGRGNANPVKH